MPLAFRSINRGGIAFGFFNIETDLLLLDQYFFFAGEFCDFMGMLAEGGEGAMPERTFPVDFIRDRQNIGDLMGAIHGVRFSGFIGDVYRRFPFPSRQEDFQQKTEGFKQRQVIAALLNGYAEKIDINFSADAASERVQLGELLFTKTVFQELILYVWLGGAPRWKEWKRPAYVLQMKEKVECSKNWLFKGIQFSACP
jgi:hypothetical protein